MSADFLHPDILIQNVSSQCIPNIVAINTFKPKKVIWVSTQQTQGILKNLQEYTQADVPNQEVWHIDARDSEALHRKLQQYFSCLKDKLRVLYHLTGGTKSMALQGLYNLDIYQQEKNTQVQGVLMDPRSQCFDVIYPHPANNVYDCARLSLSEMMAAHQNTLDTSHRVTPLAWCAKHQDLWERFRLCSPILKDKWSANKMSALHDRPITGASRHFRYAQSLPKIYRQLMQKLQEHHLITKLSYPKKNEVRYEQKEEDVVKLLNGGWLECWLASVLYQSDIQWKEAYASAVVIEGKGGKQEFDFLGASNCNRLVYWSCKTDRKLSNDKLFEVDALRDGIAGADFHVAGLLHTADLMPTMQAKAKRMNLKLVNALEADAADKIIHISRG